MHKQNIIVRGICVSVMLAFAVNTRADVSLTLGDALRRADSEDLQVMMANARLEQAIARIQVAHWDLLPHVEGTVGGGRQTADLRAEGLSLPIPGIGPHVGPYNNFDARGRISVDIFDPAAFERFEAAKKGAAFSEAELQKTREDVLALVAELFIDAQRKDQTVKLMKTLLERDEMAYELSKTYVDQGTGTQLDSNKFKSDLDQMKYLYGQAKLLADSALLDLEAALQMPLDQGIVFLEDKDLIKILEAKVSPNFDKAANADMVMADSQLQARKADQKEAYAAFLPRVAGTANYGRSGQSPSAGSNTYFVGLQATVPVWEGGLNEANLKQAKGAVKEAQANVKYATQQQQVNISKARQAIAQAQALKKAKIQQRQTAEQSLRLALHAQEIGSGSVFQVMQAKADLASAEDEYNEAQATWIFAHIDLFHARGALRDLIKQGAGS